MKARLSPPPPYVYRRLESDRHIRLLQILDVSGTDTTREIYLYRIVHVELPTTNAQLDFETVSYTWGKPDRVDSLVVEGEDGIIGLTASLSEALPYLSRHSKTKLLWIDQLSINQNDNIEKAKQVAMMAQIYKAASRAMIWLGSEDESARICKEWLIEIDKMLRKMANSDEMVPGNSNFNPDIRYVVVRSTFANPKNDVKYANAIREFWSRPWFPRGWVVQELLLSRKETFYTGDLQFSMDDMADLVAITHDGAPKQEWFSYNILINLKLHPFSEPQPLRFLRLMYNVSQEFQTSELADSLYAFLGLLPGSKFVPNYAVSIRENFTKFVASIAEDYGSLDFLSLWSANLDLLVPTTADELKGFASWVPSWNAIPLSAPYRLATGGVRALRSDITWNAALNRRHVHNQATDAAQTRKLHVKGKIIDSVDSLSSARFHRYWDADDEYLDGLLAQIKQDLTGLDDWTLKDMIGFLSIVSYNGGPASESVDKILGLKPRAWANEVSKPFEGNNQALGLCLAMGRGRRFMRTREGRLGLAPYIETRAGKGEERGSRIVILHGSSVPVVLEVVSEKLGEYKLLGDCYVEGVMHGEAVVWDERDADTFVLV